MVHLQVLCRLGEAQGVKAAVAREGAVQPRRALCVGQPQGIACALQAYLIGLLHKAHDEHGKGCASHPPGLATTNLVCKIKSA